LAANKGKLKRMSDGQDTELSLTAEEIQKALD
jgi:hypothetical protein